MKWKRNAVLLLALFVWSLAAFAAAAAVTPRQAEVWQRYLSAEDQAALAQMATQPDGAGEAPGGAAASGDQDPVAALVAMREMLNRTVPKSSPEPAASEVEQFEKDGIKGTWFRPGGASSDRVLLYLHGGGYVLGSPATGAAVSDYLARAAGIACFSLDYPLAPESPYPAAVENALKAYRMLRESGFAPENIAVAGDSAGGGLTLALLLRIRDAALPMPAGAYLISPWTDLSLGFASHETKKDVDILITREFLETLASAYAGREQRKDPLVSPAFADFQGLPPLLVHVGSHETLLDDALAAARNAAAADVPVTLKVWPGYPHVFQASHAQLVGGREALQEGAAFFRAVLGKTPQRTGPTEGRAEEKSNRSKQNNR